MIEFDADKGDLLMLYSYRCPSCGWSGDRLCRIADRDSQNCDQVISHTPAEIAEANELEIPVDLWGSKPIVRCEASLNREEISVTAKMAEQWTQWRLK